MKLEALIKKIVSVLSKWIDGKKTGKVTIEINLSQGGVGQCRVRTERRLSDED